MNTGAFKAMGRKLWLLAVVASLAALSLVEVASACNAPPGGGC